MRFLWRTAVYLAIGALCCAIALGAHFDFAAPMTYVWLILWPLMLIYYGILIALVFTVCILAGVGVSLLVWCR